MDSDLIDDSSEVQEANVHLNDIVEQLVVIGDQIERANSLLERLDNSLYVIGNVR